MGDCATKQRLQVSYAFSNAHQLHTGSCMGATLLISRVNAERKRSATFCYHVECSCVLCLCAHPGKQCGCIHSEGVYITCAK